MSIVTGPAGYGGPPVVVPVRSVQAVAPATAPVVGVVHPVMPAPTAAATYVPAATAYAPPPTMPVQGSYAPPPMPSQPMEQPQSARRSLLEGFPHPESIERQRLAHSRAIDVQLDQGGQVIRKQFAEKRKKLQDAAEVQKAQLAALVDQQCQQAEAALEDQMQQALVSLKKATLDQRHALEHQAAALAFEYQARKMQDEFQLTQAEVTNKYHESHRELHFEAEAQRRQRTPQQGAQGPGSQPPGMSPAYMMPMGGAQMGFMSPPAGTR